jgi:hypothetical protein
MIIGPLRPWDAELEEQGNQEFRQAAIASLREWNRYREQWEPLQRAEELHGIGWYQDVYLKSYSWRRKRNQVLDRADDLCEKIDDKGNRCGNVATEVHHLTYERVGNELLSDLIALCRECHSKSHGKIP